MPTQEKLTKTTSLTFIFNQKRKKVSYKGKLSMQNLGRVVSNMFGISEANFPHLRIFDIDSRREYQPQQFCNQPCAVIANSAFLIQI